MKKILFLLAAIALLTACEGRPGRDGRDGRDGLDGNDVTFTHINVAVSSAQWLYSEQADNNYYYCTVDLPELSQYVFNKGNVLVYLESTTSYGGIVRNILPYVRHYEEYNGADVFRYTQTTDYDYEIGRMTFYITNSDFVYNPTDLNEPGDRLFHIVLMY